MTDQEIIQRADELQHEARRILEDLGLFNVFKKIGKPQIIGSAENGLMVSRDIDVYVFVDDYNPNIAIDILPVLARRPNVHKVMFNNWRDYRSNRKPFIARLPKAYYIGIEVFKGQDEWQIDVWVGKREDLPPDDERLPKLTEEQRKIILQLKETWRGDGRKGYRDDAWSVDFYKAVLDHGVKTGVEFRKYLADIGKPFQLK